MSALSMAEVFGGEIILIDTEIEHAEREQGSSQAYADVHDYDIIPWVGDFDSRDLIATLDDLAAEVAFDDCIILDSYSAFWSGANGILDVANGKYTGWKDARPRHTEMVNRIKTMPCHVIVTARGKNDSIVHPDGSVDIVGMTWIGDAELAYECQIELAVDRQHSLTVGKSRCTLLAGKTYGANHEQDLAEVYAGWLAGGQTMIGRAQVKQLTDLFAQIPSANARRTAKNQFADQFGKPDALLADDFDAALAGANNIVTPLLDVTDDEEPAATDEPPAEEPAAADDSDTDADVLELAG